jgi:hypothetical protein
MYLALGTQLDIMYAINRLAQFAQEPKPKHWTAIKQVFRYLKGTQNHTLTYGGAKDLLNENLNIFAMPTGLEDWIENPQVDILLQLQEVLLPGAQRNKHQLLY